MSPVAESLIKVGERSGQMAEMLERTARFADDDFARWIDWASRLLEPVLMTVIGLVIGTVVVLICQFLSWQEVCVMNQVVRQFSLTQEMIEQARAVSSELMCPCYRGDPDLPTGRQKS